MITVANADLTSHSKAMDKTNSTSVVGGDKQRSSATVVDDVDTVLSLSDTSVTRSHNDNANGQGASLKQSFFATAEGGLGEASSLLDYGQKLAEKAAATNDPAKRQEYQNEFNGVMQKIDAVGTESQYDGQMVFASSEQLTSNDLQLINCLQSGWLEEAEKVVQERYGLTADNVPLNVVMEETPQPYLAAIEYNYDASGKATNLTLHVAVDTALPATMPNGGKKPMYDDRVITHEMVHAIMGRTMNFAGMPNWFKEGAAEFVHGADERVAVDLARNGGGMEGAEAIQDALGDGTNASWQNDSLHYSMAVTAVRYLHENIQANGYSGGIKDLMTDLKNNPDETLDEALSHVSSYGSVADFVNDFEGNNDGANFVHQQETSLELVRSTLGGDTGAIGGYYVDGGKVQTAGSVVPDIYYPDKTPLKHFQIHWPEDTTVADMQVVSSDGAAEVSYTPFKLDSRAMNLDQVDLVNDPVTAMKTIDNAALYVDKGQETMYSLSQNYQDQKMQAMMKACNKPATRCEWLTAQANQSPERVIQLLAS